MRTRQWKQVLPAEEYERRAAEGVLDEDAYVVLPEFEEGTEPEFETHVPTTAQTQQQAAERAAVSIGLTGPVAAGKSVVGDAFERRGAVVVEFDEVMRELLVPGEEALDRLREVFSETIAHPDGTIDWHTLDDLTTRSPAARERMYAVIGPFVRAEADARAKAVGDDSVLVLDLALLTDAATPRDFDHVVVVEAPAEVRVERLMAERGLDLEQAWAEIDADTQGRERSDAADVVLSNEGSIDELDAAVGAFWEDEVAPALNSAATRV